MSKMQLYMILFVISTALGFMILYVLLPFDVMSEDDADQDTKVDEVDDVDHSTDYSPNEIEEVRINHAQLMRSFMNASADPCEDFYEYACGNWEEVNPIPKDSWEYNSFDRLSDNLEVILKKVLEEPIGSDEPPDAVDKARIFYRSCTDEETIEERGAQPLLDFIEDLGGWPAMDDNWNETNFDWIQLASKLSFVENGVVLACDVEKSVKTPDNIIYLKQPLLGMDNIDYYLESEHANKLEAYTDLVESVLLLLGVDEQSAQNASEEIVKFEVRLADAKNTPDKLKPEALLLEWNISKVEEEYDGIDWERYISLVQEANATEEQPIGTQRGYVDWYYNKLSENFTDIDMETLANYMVWRGVLFVLPTLSADFRKVWDGFNELLTGQIDPKPLWKLCVRQVNEYIGMTTSALFVEKYFDASSKEVANEIIDSLKEAFEENLSDMDWLGDDTKEYALKKVRAMTASVGYPDYILSEETLNDLHDEVNIVADEHFENFIRIAKFNRKEKIGRLSKPFDPELWINPPIIVNAIYDVGANRIIVSAGIIQPPIFHPYFPQSLNYGTIGMFLGHELIHGFDDSGRYVDIDGNVNNWWNTTEEVVFVQKSECFKEQYANLSAIVIPFDVVGTITENLADNGGIRIAYIAYDNWREANSHPKRTTVDTLPDLELDGDQLFFLGFAQAFCSAIRPEAVEANKYDEHSPSKSRIIGSLMNFDKFSEAYQCPEGSPMNPSKKCRIW